MICLPDDNIKNFWDILSTIMLFITFFITPVSLAFSDDSAVEWIVIDSVINVFFLFDIIVTFFSAYYNSKFILIDKRRTIACNYLKTWFIFDLISIIPFNFIIEDGKSFNTVARFSRFNKLYKLVWLVKMFRLFKAIRDRTKISKYLIKFFWISVALERLFFFAMIFLLLIHNCTCLWYLIGEMDSSPDSWIYKGNF